MNEQIFPACVVLSFMLHIFFFDFIEETTIFLVFIQTFFESLYKKFESLGEGRGKVLNFVVNTLKIYASWVLNSLFKAT